MKSKKAINKQRDAAAKRSSVIIFAVVIISGLGYVAYDYTTYNPATAGTSAKPAATGNPDKATAGGGAGEPEASPTAEGEGDNWLFNQDSTNSVPTMMEDFFGDVSSNSISAPIGTLAHRAGTATAAAKANLRKAPANSGSNNRDSGGGSSDGGSGGGSSGGAASPGRAELPKAPEDDAGIDPDQAYDTSGQYWLETGPGEYQGTRHNGTCPRFRATDGRPATADEGNSPCPLCGS